MTLGLTYHAKMMTKCKYPEQIFQLQNDLLELERAIAATQDSIKAYEAYVECCIACDDTLKNEQQRKAKKLELERGNEEMITWRSQVSDLLHQRGLRQAELEYARNLFTCWKLSERWAIAQIELAAEHR